MLNAHYNELEQEQPRAQQFSLLKSLDMILFVLFQLSLFALVSIKQPENFLLCPIYFLILGLHCLYWKSASVLRSVASGYFTVGVLSLLCSIALELVVGVSSFCLRGDFPSQEMQLQTTAWAGLALAESFVYFVCLYIVANEAINSQLGGFSLDSQLQTKILGICTSVSLGATLLDVYAFAFVADNFFNNSNSGMLSLSSRFGLFWFRVGFSGPLNYATGYLVGTGFVRRICFSDTGIGPMLVVPILIQALGNFQVGYLQTKFPGILQKRDTLLTSMLLNLFLSIYTMIDCRIRTLILHRKFRDLDYQPHYRLLQY